MWEFYLPLLQQLFPTWRADLGQPRLPITIVQLPNFASQYKKGDQPSQLGLGHWAGVRDAQRQVRSGQTLI